jgi:hypothetical protein
MVVMTMKVAQPKVRTGWAVRNRTGQVVVIYEGREALGAAKEWAEARGYAVEAVALD